MKFLLVIAFAAAAVAVPYSQITTIKDLFQGKSNERIISGKPARLGQFPWQVAINYDTIAGSFFCGGSLISNQWVLTAAHCAKGALRFRIKLGGLTINGPEEGRVDIEATEHIVHPRYNPYMNNDIALIKLPEPIEFNDRIRPVILPFRGQEIVLGQYGSVSGWGKTSDDESSGSNTLNYVTLSAISNSECTEVYGPLNIISSTLCCKGYADRNTCQGDSGGPIVSFDWNDEATQIGIVSFVHSSGCANGYPSGFVRTESFLDWIHDNTGIPILN